MISTYHMVPSVVWQIFYEFLIFCDLFHEPLGELCEMSQIFVKIAQDDCAMTSLSLAFKIIHGMGRT